MYVCMHAHMHLCVLSCVCCLHGYICHRMNGLWYHKVSGDELGGAFSSFYHF